jgi:hypothetical protein
MHHSQALLRVANVCHPEVDDGHRRDVMLAVAKGQGMDGWITRLERRSGAGAMLAMRMLSVLETRQGVWVEGYETENHSRWASIGCWILFCALLLLLLTGACFQKKITTL